MTTNLKPSLKPESSKKNSISHQSEIELLLCCTRTKLTSSNEEQIKSLIEQGIDWEYLILLARKHGILPLLHKNLNKTCPQALPGNILTTLKKFSQANIQRNLHLTGQLLKFLTVFEKNNIDAIPFKGVILTASVYGDVGLRQFSDLDILIRKEHVPQATQLLYDLGFNPPDKNSLYSEKPYYTSNFFLESDDYQGSYDLFNPTTKVAFEMHWSLTNKQFPFPPTFQYLWEHTESVSLAGKDIVQFNKEILLVYLCAHASKANHTWSELKWVCDLAELVKSSPELNWQNVNQMAKEWRCQRVLNLGLILAYRLLDLELPEHILEEINQDKTAHSLAEIAINRMFGNDFKNIEEYIFVIRSRERWQDKITCLFHFALSPTSKEWDYIALPSFLFFLYYFIRPYRLLKGYLFN